MHATERSCHQSSLLIIARRKWCRTASCFLRIRSVNSCGVSGGGGGGVHAVSSMGVFSILTGGDLGGGVTI